MDLPIVLYVDSDAVLQEWQKPVAGHHAPAPRPVQLPESWTVVTTTSADAWTGDVPLVIDGHHSSGLVRAIRLAAGTQVFTLA